MRKILLSTLCLFALTACETPYESSLKTGFGYSDRKIGDGRYAIQVKGNANTDQAKIKTYFDRRASELCPGGYKSNDVNELAHGAVRRTEWGADKMRFPFVEGEITCTGKGR